MLNDLWGGLSHFFGDPTGMLIFASALLGGLVFGSVPGLSAITLASIVLPFTALMEPSPRHHAVRGDVRVRGLRRRHHRDPVQHSGLAGQRADRLRRLPDDPQGPRRQGNRGRRDLFGPGRRGVLPADDGGDRAARELGDPCFRPAGALRTRVLRSERGGVGGGRQHLEGTAVGRARAAARDHRHRRGGGPEALRLRLDLPDGRHSFRAAHSRVVRGLRSLRPGSQDRPRCAPAAEDGHRLPVAGGVLAPEDGDGALGDHRFLRRHPAGGSVRPSPPS